ncbi:MAG: hypothetical protein CMH13_16750 [Martelella sp.]|uniref:TAXI family TRAP transporter solute-binding subunit n=1 Tax=unclassified Martelella TaxID=2629616 RepID=UPI000C4B994D|nr:TAXI family TRAP transporter solute-binding subunit [Martelella sp.]MAU22146.1 hypothetical protein [Martelella sp.]
MFQKLSIIAGLALMPASAVLADDVKLPSTIAVTAADVGGTSYNQAIAIGKALQDAYGVSLRVVGTGNPQAKVAPVRDGRMPFSIAGSDVFFAFEGVDDYASPDWGPQDLRAVSLVGGDNCLTYVVAGDAGIETMADFKGKRIPWVVGSSPLQANAKAMLAFGGLTIDDVTLVEMPSYGAAIDAMINGQVDGVTTVSTGGLVEKAVAGPRGVKYVAYPHDDAEGWERMRAVNPHFAKRVATQAAGGLKEPLECIGVPYPDVITYSEDDNLVYNFTRALIDQVDVYSKADPSTAGFAADKQMFEWTVPYHEASIKAYREAGVWTDELDAHNDALLARAAVLADAWATTEDIRGDADFQAKWMKIRAEALQAAGMPAYFQ